jgi:hypothetical protein
MLEHATQKGQSCPILKQVPSGGVKVMSVVIYFTGSKTSRDNLSFLKAQAVCSETLGLKNCTASTGYWTWNLEGEANVYDDASNWTVLVTDQYHYTGNYRDSNNMPQPFKCSETNTNDGPQVSYLQQPAGQHLIFYIDGPGPFHGINPSNGCQLGSSPIDTMTDCPELSSYLHQ